jgi:hypothetical protein
MQLLREGRVEDEAGRGSAVSREQSGATSASNIAVAARTNAPRVRKDTLDRLGGDVDRSEAAEKRVEHGRFHRKEVHVRQRLETFGERRPISVEQRRGHQLEASGRNGAFRDVRCGVRGLCLIRSDELGGSVASVRSVGDEFVYERRYTANLLGSVADLRQGNLSEDVDNPVALPRTDETQEERP